MGRPIRVLGPIRAAGDGGLVVTLSDNADAPAGALSPAGLRAATDAVAQRLTAELGAGLIDLVPAAGSLLVLIDPAAATPAAVRRWIRAALAEAGRGDDSGTDDAGDARHSVTLPVYYGDDVAWDLSALAEHAGLTPEATIDAHQQATYTVEAIGFAPGFAYLAGLDARLAMPRLDTPRTRVPAGAVAIAERRSAVYPAESPGGWRIVGRCPLRLFDPLADPPMPYAVGDTVRFSAIDRDRFVELGGRLDDGPRPS